jgi:hypothetical protein
MSLFRAPQSWFGLLYTQELFMVLGTHPAFTFVLVPKWCMTTKSIPGPRYRYGSLANRPMAEQEHKRRRLAQGDEYTALLEKTIETLRIENSELRRILRQAATSFNKSARRLQPGKRSPAAKFPVTLHGFTHRARVTPFTIDST